MALQLESRANKFVALADVELASMRSCGKSACKRSKQKEGNQPCGPERQPDRQTAR